MDHFRDSQSVHIRASESSTTGAVDEEILADTSLNLDYHALLREAETTDLSDLERSGCVTISEPPAGAASEEKTLILFLPKLGFLACQKAEGAEDDGTATLKRMLLLFVQKAHTAVHHNFTVVYGHTPMSLLSQHPVIYSYYKILPRQYKKNLKRLYIVHPQMGIRMFFEFARVFLSHKFYSKLHLVDNIAALQQHLPQVTAALPCRFVKLEDDEYGLKFNGTIPSLKETFVPPIGTTKLLADCVSYIRKHNGMTRQGLFRIAGDEALLSLAKVRMMATLTAEAKSHSHSVSSAAQQASGTSSGASAPVATTNHGTFIVHDKIIIGKELISNSSSSHHPVSSNTSSPTAASTAAVLDMHDTQAHGGRRKSVTFRKAVSDVLSGRKKENYSKAIYDSTAGGHTSLSFMSSEKHTHIAAVCFTEIDTVAQILKFSLRQLPEPLITPEAYKELMEISNRLKDDPNYSKEEWGMDIKRIVNSMPNENKSTLNHLLFFLAEVASYSAINLMDASNLGVVFAPTITRSFAEDHSCMLSEMGHSKNFVAHMIQSYSDQFPPVPPPPPDDIDPTQLEQTVSGGRMASRMQVRSTDNPILAYKQHSSSSSGRRSPSSATTPNVENGIHDDSEVPPPPQSQLEVSEEDEQKLLSRLNLSDVMKGRLQHGGSFRAGR